MRKKNTYFQFKQFRVEQDQTAMKVSTEACILGAYSHSNAPQNILDIGSGTGLLALMLAQRYSESKITTVEIDESAFLQAQDNIKNSAFSGQIECFHQSIQSFSSQVNVQYDMIVSNPPFYENHLLSGNQEQDKALHQETLNFREIVEIVRKHLKPEGIFWLILPPYQMEQFIDLAQSSQLYLNHELKVFHSPKHTLFRKICSFVLNQAKSTQNMLYIKDEQEIYTENFKNLLKDFYLAF
ncbi:MAG: methyltransferase [Raineya sp.]|jgi:tRNA1Val (adenine37-N6)-methyltransferase|nr:methyltransferase [Raineya sp.]